MKTLKRYFVTGLVVVVPVVFTVYVLVVLFQFIDDILGRYINAHFKNVLGFYIPGIGVLLFLLIIFFTGFLASRFIGKKIFSGLGKWFSGLPLIKIIYPALSQVVQFLLQQKEFGFKKTVLIEYPSAGLWSIGFLTNEQFYSINTACAQDLVAVFVPNTPGPFSGYVVFVARNKVKFLDMPVAEAIQIILSGGVCKGV